MIFKSMRERNQFIIDNKGLVHRIYTTTFDKKNINKSFKDDFIQVGLIAFDKALDTFDPNQFKLSVWIKYPVLSAMIKFSCRSTNVITLGVNRNRHKVVQMGDPALLERMADYSHERPPSALIEKLLDKALTPREKEIIYGMIINDKTSPELGKKFKFTGSGIRKIRDGALRKLRTYLESQAA